VHDPAIGGGRWIGEGCHFVDLAAAVIGHPPTRVQAEASKPDALSALLRFADGSVATVEYLSTGHAAVPKEQLEIVGEGSVILLDDYRTLRWDTPGGSGRDARRGQDKGHRAETAAFVAGARAGVAPIPIAEQMMSMRATFAVADALATGMPITLG
jgi:predicted dehydrogenase